MSSGLRIGLARVTLYPGEPKLFMNDPDGPVIRDLDRRMTRAQLVAKRLVRVRTGKLLTSIRKNRGFSARGPYVEVVAGGRGIPNAQVEEFGSAPHIIRARRKKALRFVGSNGQVQFRRMVHHPGTQGSGYLSRALPFAGR